jgi:hypothetical protein
MKRYLVSSPGRVGSHIVTACIRACGVPVLHTHNPFFLTDNDSITGLVLVDRKDLFATIMSNCITWHTGQSVKYDNVNVQPFAVDYNDFSDHYYRQKYYKDSHDLSRAWGSINILYFEDFIFNYDYIFEQLQLTLQPELLVKDSVKNIFTSRAPYNYANLILNKDQCKIWFDQLEEKGAKQLWQPIQVFQGLKEKNETWE